MLCLCRSLHVLEKAANILEPTDFDSISERSLGVLYGVARDHYREFRKLIPFQLLSAQVEQRVLADRSFCESAYDMNELVTMLDMINRAEDSIIQPMSGLKILQDFIDERKVRPQFQQLSHSGSLNASMTKLQNMLRTTRITTSTPIAAFDLEGDNYDVSPRTPMNFRPFDMLLGGGTRKGEVILCMGPIGGGKTLSSINCSIATARYSPNPDDLSLYFTYEQPWNPIMRDRFFVGATGISRTRIEGRQVGQMDRDVQEALQYIKKQIMTKLNVLDMSKPDGNSGDFCAGAEGIINIVNRYINDGRKVKYIYLDWLGAMVESYRAARSLKEEKYQTMTSQVTLLKQYINSIGANLIITHQLNSDAGRKVNPFAKHSLYEAADARMVATMVDHCFTFGAIHRETQLMCMYNAKDSRSVGVQHVWCQVGKDNHQLSVPACQNYTVWANNGSWSITPIDDQDSSSPFGAPTI